MPENEQEGEALVPGDENVVSIWFFMSYSLKSSESEK